MRICLFQILHPGLVLGSSCRQLSIKLLVLHSELFDLVLAPIKHTLPVLLEVGLLLLFAYFFVVGVVELRLQFASAHLNLLALCGGRAEAL